MCASKSLSCVCAAAGPQANKASRTALENCIIRTLLASSAAKEGLALCPPAARFFCIDLGPHLFEGSLDLLGLAARHAQCRSLGRPRRDPSLPSARGP